MPLVTFIFLDPHSPPQRLISCGFQVLSSRCSLRPARFRVSTLNLSILNSSDSCMNILARSCRIVPYFESIYGRETLCKSEVVPYELVISSFKYGARFNGAILLFTLLVRWLVQICQEWGSRFPGKTDSGTKGNSAEIPRTLFYVL